MITTRPLLTRIVGLFTHRNDERIDHEIQTHLDLLADEHVARGLTRHEALAAARRDFGGVQAMKEVYREQRGVRPISEFVRDIGHAWRMLRRNPAFAAVAIFSITLGIGANSAIFTLINAVMLRPLPVARPGELQLFTVVGPGGSPDDDFSYPLYQQFRDTTRSFLGVAASGDYAVMRLAHTDGATPQQIERIEGERVTSNFFTVLGVDAVVGRTFTAVDERAGHPEVPVVLSDGYWRRRFGSSAEVVGRQIMLDGVPATIVGVAPPGFFGFVVDRPADLWFSMEAFARLDSASGGSTGFDLASANSFWLRLIGRLAAGATAAGATAEADALFRVDLAEQANTRAARRGAAFTAQQKESFLNRRLVLADGRTGANDFRSQFSRPLLIMMIAVGLILLIACANVANLLLARAAARQREMSIRLAIGAGRGRLVRQLLAESLLLAAIGGLAGFASSEWIARGLMALLPERSVGLNIEPDGRVVAFTVVASLLSTLLFGLTPALRATRGSVNAGLKTSGGGVDQRSRFTLNKALVVSQVALSVFLVGGAALFARTLQNLRGIDTGFTRDHVMVFMLEDGPGYSAAQRTALQLRLLERLQQLPGVDAASVSSFGLLRGANWSQRIAIPGYTPGRDEDMTAYGQAVGPRFFETMRIPVVAGRDFGAAEAMPASSPRPVVVINQVLARRFFGDDNPIGRTLILGTTFGPYEIVGIAKDTKYSTLREQPQSTFYVSAFQRAPFSGNEFLVRGTPSDVSVATMSRLVGEIDPGVQLILPRTIAGVVEETIATERSVAMLAGLFSVFALMLAAVGLYGVLAYIVTRRTAEIAVRLALGARRQQVVGMVVRDTLTLTAIGFAIGLPAAFAAARLVRTLLYGVAPIDLPTAATTALVMMAVAVLAAWVPACRAAGIQPTVALRYE